MAGIGSAIGRGVKGFGKEVAKEVGTNFLRGALGGTVGGAIAGQFSGSDTGAQRSGAQTGLTGDSTKDMINSVRDLQKDLNYQTSIIQKQTGILSNQTAILASGFNMLERSNQAILKQLRDMKSFGPNMPNIDLSGGGGGGGSSKKTGGPRTGGSWLKGLGKAGSVAAGGLAAYDEYQESGSYGRAAAMGAGTGLGAWGGAAGGALAGTIVGGPIGAIIGGLLGGFAGGSAGNWGTKQLLGPSKSNPQSARMTELSKKEEANKQKAQDLLKESITFTSKELVFKADNIKFEIKNNTAGGVGGVGDNIPSGLGNGTGGIGNNANIKPGPAATGDAATAMKFFESKGWSKAQAAGIVGNLKVESGNFSPAVISGQRRGDGGRAVGVAQWHPARQQTFQRVMGKSVSQASFKEQLEFVNWELNNTEKRAGNMLRQATDPAQAAAVVDQYYERSSGAHRARRIAAAKGYAEEKQAAAAPAATPAAPAAAPTGSVTPAASVPGPAGKPAPTQSSTKGVPSGNIIALGKWLQSQGIRVSEHPAFGGVRGKHSRTGGHYDGRAIDVNIGYGIVEANHPVYGKRFDAIAKQVRAAGYKVIWRARGHYNHMHIMTGAGGGGGGDPQPNMADMPAKGATATSGSVTPTMAAAMGGMPVPPPRPTGGGAAAGGGQSQYDKLAAERMKLINRYNETGNYADLLRADALWKQMQGASRSSGGAAVASGGRRRTRRGGGGGIPLPPSRPSMLGQMLGQTASDWADMENQMSLGPETVQQAYRAGKQKWGVSGESDPFDAILGKDAAIAAKEESVKKLRNDLAAGKINPLTPVGKTASRYGLSPQTVGKEKRIQTINDRFIPGIISGAAVVGPAARLSSELTYIQDINKAGGVGLPASVVNDPTLIKINRDAERAETQKARKAITTKHYNTKLRHQQYMLEKGISGDDNSLPNIQNKPVYGPDTPAMSRHQFNAAVGGGRDPFGDYQGLYDSSFVADDAANSAAAARNADNAKTRADAGVTVNNDNSSKSNSPADPQGDGFMPEAEFEELFK